MLPSRQQSPILPRADTIQCGSFWLGILITFLLGMLFALIAGVFVWPDRATSGLPVSPPPSSTGNTLIPITYFRNASIQCNLGLTHVANSLSCVACSTTAKVFNTTWPGVDAACYLPCLAPNTACLQYNIYFSSAISKTGIFTNYSTFFPFAQAAATNLWQAQTVEETVYTGPLYDPIYTHTNASSLIALEILTFINFFHNIFETGNTLVVQHGEDPQCNTGVLLNGLSPYLVYQISIYFVSFSTGNTVERCTEALYFAPFESANMVANYTAYCMDLMAGLDNPNPAQRDMARVHMYNRLMALFIAINREYTLCTYPYGNSHCFKVVPAASLFTTLPTQCALPPP